MSLLDAVSLGAVYIVRRARSREGIARDNELIARNASSSVTICRMVSWWDNPERPGYSFDVDRQHC